MDNCAVRAILEAVSYARSPQVRETLDAVRLHSRNTLLQRAKRESVQIYQRVVKARLWQLRKVRLAQQKVRAAHLKRNLERALVDSAPARPSGDPGDGVFQGSALGVQIRRVRGESRRAGAVLARRLGRKPENYCATANRVRVGAKPNRSICSARPV